ncbi:hypothetical protein A0H81_12976 [Grifola frondosa]|uniref:Uncharacterized protein n=1 Tax=Grifola frondosa TaxID=5627 RepID=A0A1C7LSY2_GRIFR|nr:hypothetical protein A0H81_12976 [Grifola frondosa]
MRRAKRCSSAVKVTKLSLELFGKFGSPVPFVQAIVGTSLQIMQYAEVVQGNRKACKELAQLVGEITEALLRATEGAQAHEFDDRLMLDIADLQWQAPYYCLRVSTTVQLMTRQRLLHRFLHRDKHTGEIAEHRECLKNAMAVFQIRNGISMRFVLARNHQEVLSTLEKISSQLPSSIIDNSLYAGQMPGNVPVHVLPRF